MKSKKDKRKKNEKNNSKSKSAAVLERDASTEIKPREPSFELDYPSFLYPSTLCENRTDITHELIDTKDIRYVVYNDEAQLGDIQRMAEKDLAEPYSVFTYSTEHGKMVGTILCKIDLETNDDETIKKGYIGMLIVDSTLRNRGIGLKLSMMGIEKMIALGCESIVLETEASNAGALKLYEKLGFIREELLPKYYLSVGDAYRLKLYIDPKYSLMPCMETAPDSGSNIPI